MPSSPAASPAAASPVETPAIPRELVVAEEINSLVARLEVLLNEETPDIERAQRASTHGNSLSAKISEINRGEAPLRADVARTLYRDGKILESLLLSVPRTAEVLHSLRYGSNAVGIEAAVRGTGDNYDATMLGVIRLLFDHGVLPPLAHADIIRDPGANTGLLRNRSCSGFPCISISQLVVIAPTSSASEIQNPTVLILVHIYYDLQ